MYPVEYLTYGLGRTADMIIDPNTPVKPEKEFKITDHLGSTRVALRATGTTEELDYEPFGTPVAGDAPRKGFIDKEVDKESDLGDYGVRKYDSEMGRFTSIDPLWEEYRGWSPYQYGANNPLISIDPNGDSIIVLVDNDGAGGSGHMAVLIGNDKDGWLYVSKNGTSQNFGALGFADKTVITRVGTFKDFSSSKEEEYSRYDEAFLLESDSKVDDKMEEAAMSSAIVPYSVVGLSCLDVADDALEAGGFNKGNVKIDWSRPERVGSQIALDRMPKVRFQGMRYMNPDSKDMTEMMQFYRNPYSVMPSGNHFSTPTDPVN